MARETGGAVGLRDGILLDSALNSIFQTFDGKELYPTVEEKGARLGFNLISNHAFVDGNKRIGMLVMMTSLEINGIRIGCADEDIIEIALGVASGKTIYKGLLDWVRRHGCSYLQSGQEQMKQGEQGFISGSSLLPIPLPKAAFQRSD